MRGNQNYKNNFRGKRGGKNGHNRYNNNSNYYNKNNKFNNYNNNYNYNNDKNYQDNQYQYNNEEYYDNNYYYGNQDNYQEGQNNNDNYNNSYGNKNYYNRGFKRYNEEKYGENNYANKKKNKREYYNKLRKEQKEQEQKEEEEKKEEEKKEEEKKEEEVAEKNEEKEIPEEEDEQTKEELNQINEDIKANIDQHKQNLKEITKQDPKKDENIFKTIINSNEKIKNNPILIYNIMEIFKAKKSSDEMQGEFLDLLGFDEIATIEQFITNRDEIIEAFEVAKTVLESNNQKIKSAQENLKLFGNDTIVETQIAKNKKKKGAINEMEKVQKENNKILEYLGFEHNFISRNIEKNQEFIGGDQIIKEEENFNKKELHPVKIIFGDVGYNENIEKEKEIYDEVIERKNNYTMVKVKTINKKRNKVEPINVIKVLPKWAHKCFNFQFFNEIQSAVFDKSFNSDENLLITAPTGAGKTNIALVTILREIEKELKLKNMNNIDDKFDFSKFKWDFKVLFLVPLKALANEFINKFTEQLGYFNLVINEFSGDVDLTKE